ncbi:hypothetical protein LTR56_013866 [Elasticomyces elasticus]|nr:hypothetical protein LTR56_013866 [Elasticomyces elasticus]KAK3660529.1 hypothetical protein LTR22_007970 [Elasticomyces elasticus]KAK4923857.1 hypothetical protein LTR49_009005 [Elasticomyces elasticus]KAK5741841.1 hypothetical protein LTS12_024441 [Elasticomyces elasticus]
MSLLVQHINGKSKPPRSERAFSIRRHRGIKSQAETSSATYATVKALHLLSGTVPIEKSFGYLEHARQTIKEASKTGDPAALKDPAMLQTLYERTAELWALYQREKAGELFGAWPDAVEVKAQA